MALRRTRSRKHEGAAYAEAVVMLPVFIAIFASYFALFNAHTARITANNEARTEAWETAVRGRELFEGPPDSGCAAGAAGDGCRRLRDETSTIDGLLSGADIPGPLASLIRQVIARVFGPLAIINASEDYAGVALAGTSDGAATAGYQLVYNTQRSTLQSLVRRAICGMIPDALSGFMSRMCP